jgi:hypothetical protein
MENVQPYAIALGGASFTFLLIQYRYYIHSFIYTLTSFFLRLSYIHQKIFAALCQVLFIITNLYFTFFSGLFHPNPIAVISIQAGNLALINFIPLAAGLSYNLLTIIFNLSSKTFQKMHQCMGLTLILLICIHAISRVIDQQTFSLSTPGNIWAVIVSLLRHIEYLHKS